MSTSGLQNPEPDARYNLVINRAGTAGLVTPPRGSRALGQSRAC